MTSAPRMSDEGLPAILTVMAVSGAAIALLVWWGSKKPPQQPKTT
jgi:hypothetical protein